MITVVNATVDHVLDFMDNVRPIDAEEVLVASGETLESHLSYFLENIHEVKALVDGEVVLGIAGVQDNPNNPGVGIIWMLMTHEVESRKMEFLRFSRRYLKDELFTVWRGLVNVVYKRNKLHVDWLNWLGAEWIEERENFSMFLISPQRKER